MPDATSRDQYVAHFDPQRYLSQYYSHHQLAADDAELFRIMSSWLKSIGRVFDSALDVGCGPTIHNTFAIAPYARRIELADFLPANLAEVRKWLDDAPDAHDWDPLFRGVLECQGVETSQLEARKALYRSRVSALRSCDLHKPNPLGQPQEYDLVTSFFCAECMAASREEWEEWEEWEEIMRRIFRLVKPGGALFIATVGNCSAYAVLGTWFRVIPVGVDDFRALLPRHGFPLAGIEAHVVPAPDWAEDGFDHICLIGATKGESKVPEQE